MTEKQGKQSAPQSKDGGRFLSARTGTILLVAFGLSAIIATKIINNQNEIAASLDRFVSSEPNQQFTIFQQGLVSIQCKDLVSEKPYTLSKDTMKTLWDYKIATLSIRSCYVKSVRPSMHKARLNSEEYIND